MVIGVRKKWTMNQFVQVTVLEVTSSHMESVLCLSYIHVSIYISVLGEAMPWQARLVSNGKVTLS